VASRKKTGSEQRSGTQTAPLAAQSNGSGFSIEAAALSGRPRQTDRTGDVERAIFAATERLLTEHSARDISVAMILKESAVSRATFYHYFSSKWEVVNFLASSVMAEIYEQVQQFVAGRGDVQPREALRRSIEEGCQTWARHGAVLRAILDHWREIPELRALLLAVLEPFKTALAAEIDRERSAGIAPDGPPSEPLVTALLWSSLTCLHVAGLAEVPDIADEEQASTLLTAIWMRALYGDAALG